MPEPSTARREPANLDSGLIRVANIVGWCWLAVSFGAVVFFSVAQAPRLLPTLWLLARSGRVTSAHALPFNIGTVVFLVWVLVAVFAAVMVVGQRFGKPTRSWATVLVILFSWGVTVVLADVLVGSAPQVGLASPLDEIGAYVLVAPAAQPVTFVVGLLALVTVIGLPLLALARPHSDSTNPDTRVSLWCG